MGLLDSLLKYLADKNDADAAMLQGIRRRQEAQRIARRKQDDAIEESLRRRKKRQVATVNLSPVGQPRLTSVNLKAIFSFPKSSSVKRKRRRH